MPRGWDGPGKQGSAGPPQRPPIPPPFPPLNSRSSHCPRPAPQLASMQSSPLRSTHPLFGILSALVVSELPADPLCFPLAHTSPCSEPPALHPRRPSALPTPTPPSPYIPHLNSCCTRATGLESVFPHFPPNRSPPSPTLQPPRTRVGGAVGCTGG